MKKFEMRRALIIYTLILSLCAAFPIAVLSINDGNPYDDAAIYRHFTEVVSSLPSAFSELSKYFSVISFVVTLSVILPLTSFVCPISRAPPSSLFTTFLMPVLQLRIILS
jgi:hypothetical protein